MSMSDIGFIGLGNISKAIIKGIRLSDKQLKISSYDIDKKKFLGADSLYIKKSSSIEELLGSSKIIFCCVKPDIFPEILSIIKPILTHKHLFVSTAAGIKIKFIQSILKKNKIIRIMPNLPSAVGLGVTAVKYNSKCTKSDIKNIIKILDKIGTTIMLKDEKNFDSITAISGSGPAFFALYYNALLKFCIKSGFSKKVSQNIAHQTIKGTLEFLKISKITPQNFIKMVSSKGGTTEEGIKSLTNLSFEKTVNNAHKRAERKSKLISDKVSSIIKK